MRIDPLLSPDDFVGLDAVTHLCAGGEAPWLKSHDAVYAEFARLKSAGPKGRAEIYARGERCRLRIAQLWGVPPHRVAFLPSATEGMNWLARGLDWRPGDNVVSTSIEYPSVAYAWRQLLRRDVDVRLVPHRGFVVHECDLLAAVDSRTRVVAVSHVSPFTGQCLDLPRLADGTRRSGALLAVDATHSSGVLSVPAALTDLTVSSSYKWMLATHGVAPCYMSERAEAQTDATTFGWHNLNLMSADGFERQREVPEKPMPERLEPGNPAMLVVLHLGWALEVLLGIGMDRVQAHALALAEQAATGLANLGVRVISPQDPGARSGNTCFVTDHPKAMNDRLAQRGVLCWNDYGRVRVSTHVYNSSTDVSRLLNVLADL
ncbi:MAG: aminotransferase class V-fold PLP-dependent enzyme [Acidobacteria bacterium]|nr:aminotransferase class V-fold PLP-dependent enzyme [Acidobacteriota bacterium]